MTNPYGRTVIVPLTNQSGGGVVAGDVVVIDTGHDSSFTTTTTANFTGGVGVAQQTIGAGGTGLVALEGQVDLVNVNASVTRGHFGATFTVAKQATDAGSARGTGTFCQFITGGTTPRAVLYPVDLLGSSLTNPMTTTGDIIYSSDNSGTPARLAAVAAGKFLASAGTSTAPAYGSVLSATSFAGYNTVGGSFLNMNGSYAKKVTLAATSLVLNIGAHVKGNGTNAQGLSCAVVSDVAGTPTSLIARGGAGYDVTNSSVVYNNHLTTTARWIEMPVNAYLAAGDYWIVAIGGNGATGLQLAYDGSGSDKTSNFYPSDNGNVAWSAGTNKHSIRALILT